jgi:prolyl oligopeptidase
MRIDRHHLRSIHRCGPAAAIILLAEMLCAQKYEPPAAVPPPPATDASDPPSVIHGVSVADPYRWLEDAQSPATRAWITAQQQYTNALLSSRPGMNSLREEVRRLVEIDEPHRVLYRSHRYFIEKKPAGKETASLFMREGASGPDRVVVDPASLGDPSAAVELLNVSADGQLLAYGLRHGGRDELSIRFRDLRAGLDLAGDTLPEARYLYWSLPIAPDRSSVIYVKFETAGPRIYRHIFGQPVTDDLLLFGQELGPEKLLAAGLSPDGQFLLITVLHGASGSTDLFLKDLRSNAPARIVVSGIEATFNGIVSGNTLYIETDWKAGRGQVFTAGLDDPGVSHWKVLVPEQPDATVESIALTKDRLIVRAMRDAHSELQVFTLNGALQPPIPLPGLGSVSSLDADPAFTEVCFSYSSFQTPTGFFAWHTAPDSAGALEPISVPRTPERLRDVIVEQVWYRSRDGVRVPMFLAHRRDVKADGNLPVLLYGYGGFNWAQLPEFSPEEALWLERGGVYAVANIRGGNEFGEDWHRAGELAQKQNSFDDFAYAAKWLISQKYTRPERLAIQGLSNGGLLVAASITQHPELFGAAIGRYPLIDMVRYERFTIARWWASEFGSVSDPTQFKTLYAYSPYHHVVKGTAYPAVLFVSGDGDTRVDPSHARKMTAMLQGTTSSGKPVLLLYDSKSGHSGTLPAAEQIEQTANELEFLDWQLQVPEVAQ